LYPLSPNIILDLHICLRFQLNPELQLVIKRAVKTAIIQVNFHIRHLKVSLKKSLLMLHA
jgi:hypothetical protein